METAEAALYLFNFVVLPTDAIVMLCSLLPTLASQSAVGTLGCVSDRFVEGKGVGETTSSRHTFFSEEDRGTPANRLPAAAGVAATDWNT